MEITVENIMTDENFTSLGDSVVVPADAIQGVSRHNPAGKAMGFKGRKQVKVARKDGKGQQSQLGRIPLSDVDMNIEATSVAAKRKPSEEEEEINLMQIDEGLAKRCKRKQGCDELPISEVMEASLKWSPKIT